MSGHVLLGRAGPAAVTRRCDVVVVGTGAGGAMAARELARRGLDVIALEGGAYHRARDFNQREDEMLEALYQDSGARATDDLAIRVLQGRGVGGSTVHNTNLCKRIPDSLLSRWALPGWSAADLAPHYDATERELGVRPMGPAEENPHNGLFRRGCEALGWRGAYLSHNRHGCAHSGFCELGCAFDAKLNALRVLAPEAVRAGATIYADTRVNHVRVEAGRATGVEGVLLGADGRVRGTMRIDARAVVLAASATSSQALCDRSGIADPRGRGARSLRLHPGVAVAGVFPTEVRGWQGIPQSYECTEWLSFEGGSERRAWLVPAFAHPVGTAAFLSVAPSRHAETMTLYPRLAVVAAMIHDESGGRAYADGERVRIDYELTAADRAQLTLGLDKAARVLFAAGAERVLLPFARAIEVRRPDDLPAALTRGVRALDPSLVSVHPHGSLPMGEGAQSPLDPRGRHRGAKGLWVADGSVFPTSIGVPPQLNIYTFARRIAGFVADEL